MTALQKLLDNLYLKQWSIGLCEIKIGDIIRNRIENLKLTWIPLNNKNKFYADPFIFKSQTGEYSILFEDYDYRDQYGKISQLSLSDDFKVISSKLILDTKSHLSYPSIFIENNEIFVFPEAGRSGKLSGYLYNTELQSLIHKGDIIDLPLIDSTILKYHNKYWIFCTMIGKNVNTSLYIYYADSLFGTYTPHKGNPVKCDIEGSRPAGNFIEVDGALFRPAQNSGKYYGGSINIYKLISLSEDTFVEELYMTIKPNKKDKYNFGTHTINAVDDKVVVDGLRRRFLPVTQVITFIRKKFKVTG